MTLDEKIKADDELLKNSEKLSEYFEEQLGHVQDPALKTAISKYLDLQPKFKMEKATSASGKYHPEFQNGYGGNGKHAKNMVKILEVFERAYPNLDWDAIYVAAILHDLSKYSSEKDKWTDAKHPVTEAKSFLSYAKSVKKDLPSPRKWMKKAKLIAHLIYWHDGRFNCTFATREQINKNYTKGLVRKMKYASAFVLHSADMLSASRPLWSEIF